MRRWLKENNLSAGSGAPLHDIAAIEDLQRALAAFSGETHCSSVYSLSVCVYSLSVCVYGLSVCVYSLCVYDVCVCVFMMSVCVCL